MTLTLPRSREPVMPDQPPDPDTARLLAAAQVAHDMALLFEHGLRDRRYEREEDGFLKAPSWYYRDLAETIVRLLEAHPGHGAAMLEEFLLERIEKCAYARQDRLQDKEVVRWRVEELRRRKREDPDRLFK